MLRLASESNLPSPFFVKNLTSLVWAIGSCDLSTDGSLVSPEEWVLPVSSDGSIVPR